MGIIKSRWQAKSAITNNYKKQQKMLKLSNTPKTWKSVLGYQDWTSLNILLLCKQCGLFIENSQIDFKQFNIFCKYSWSNIKQLSLSQNKIGPKAIKLLVRLYMPLLQQLWLSQCQIGDQGVKLLSKGKWQNMYAMKISGNNNIIDGLIGFTLHGWKKLNYLWVQTKDCKIIHMTLLSNMKQNSIIILVKKEEDNLIRNKVEQTLKLTDKF